MEPSATGLYQDINELQDAQKSVSCTPTG